MRAESWNAWRPCVRGVMSFALVACLVVPAFAASVTLDQLFAERARSVVAVEFFVETEIDRRPSTHVGMVADDKGLVVLLDSAIPGWLPPSQLKDFIVFRPGFAEGIAADYLGQDYLTGWHFLRAKKSLGDDVQPCTRWTPSEPRLGDEMWGVGLMGKEFDFQPYLMIGRVTLLQKLPQRVAFTAGDVASPGAPVFAREGELVGWARNPVPQERVLFLGEERYNAGVVNPNGSASFFLSSEVLPYLSRAPLTPVGQRVPWFGVVGLQPVDREVADFLKLENRSAVVISDVIKGGPAEAAGIQKRDILVSLGGEPFPRFSPDRVVTSHLEREILMRRPGDVMRLGIVRGSERIERAVTLGTQPTALKEADRRYFERLGFTAREYVLYDRISRNSQSLDDVGVVTNFVKPNGPANEAGLRVGDLVREIDGQPISDYAGGVYLFEAIERDPARTEFVLLVSRASETQVIRVRLK